MPVVINYLKNTCDRYRELNFLLELLGELENKEQKKETGDES
jgi:hypothetical protein